MRKKIRSHFRRSKNVKHVNAAVFARISYQSWIARAIWLSGFEPKYTKKGIVPGARRKITADDAARREAAMNAMNLKNGRRRAAWTGAVA